MHFCFITPTSELDQYATRSTYHVVLAPYCRDTKYFEWYRQRGRAGDFLILDNGAYEGCAPNWNEYVKIANDLQPNVLTLPDVLGDFNETQKHIRYFLRDYESKLKCKALYMVVLQAGRSELFQWIEAYQLAERVAQWIAFPRLLGPSRITLIRGLHKIGLWNRHRKHHAFGMNNGNVDELRVLSTLNIVSCDSSAPVWRGMHGYKLSEPAWPDIPFNALVKNADRPFRSCVEYNIEEVLNACQLLGLEVHSSSEDTTASAPQSNSENVK